MKHFDIIIIGSGGGTKLRPAADLWKTAAIIEKSALWWACLNRGCIPSKMLIYPSDVATHVREDSQRLHIKNISEPKTDFYNLVNSTIESIEKDSEGIEKMYKSNKNITLYRWHAHFKSNKVIHVCDEDITADKIYVATWAVPNIPDIDGLAGTPFITSTEALRTCDLPKKMIVIGWWYIAVELGHVFGSAWCEMHFLVRSKMISSEDKDIREIFEKDFSQRYNVHFNVSPIKVAYNDWIFSVTLDNWEIMKSDSLFVATGVKPMTERLGLENTDISLNKRWHIEVDEYLETKVPWVYALWDVVGNYLFRHSVNYEWEYLFSQHYSWWEKSPIKYPPMPHAIFTYPQIAGVWVTEDELIKIGKVEWQDYETALHNYKNSAMGEAMKAEVWCVKLIAEKSTGKIIGAHILWEKASDIIHMMIVLISAGETVEFMLKNMIFIHPALSEVIRNAARTLSKKI